MNDGSEHKKAKGTKKSVLESKNICLKKFKT